jgi:hypothetical protein
MHNHAQQGGAMLVRDESIVTVANSALINNSAAISGCALQVDTL